MSTKRDELVEALREAAEYGIGKGKRVSILLAAALEHGGCIVTREAEKPPWERCGESDETGLYVRCNVLGGWCHTEAVGKIKRQVDIDPEELALCPKAAELGLVKPTFSEAADALRKARDEVRPDPPAEGEFPLADVDKLLAMLDVLTEKGSISCEHPDWLPGNPSAMSAQVIRALAARVAELEALSDPQGEAECPLAEEMEDLAQRQIVAGKHPGAMPAELRRYATQARALAAERDEYLAQIHEYDSTVIATAIQEREEARDQLRGAIARADQAEAELAERTEERDAARAEVAALREWAAELNNLDRGVRKRLSDFAAKTLAAGNRAIPKNSSDIYTGLSLQRILRTIAAGPPAPEPCAGGTEGDDE